MDIELQDRGSGVYTVPSARGDVVDIGPPAIGGGVGLVRNFFIITWAAGHRRQNGD